MLSWITVSRGYPRTSAARLITSSPFSGKMATCRHMRAHDAMAGLELLQLTHGRVIEHWTTSDSLFLPECKGQKDLPLSFLTAYYDSGSAVRRRDLHDHRPHR